MYSQSNCHLPDSWQYILKDSFGGDVLLQIKHTFLQSVIRYKLNEDKA